MNILKRTAGAVNWLIVLAAVYSGVTQPLYLVVPKSQEQIQECLAQNAGCASPCATASPCMETSGCAAVPCQAVEHAGCTGSGEDRPPTEPRCCSLIATQPGVEGSRPTLDDFAGRAPALLPVAAVDDILPIIGRVEDRAPVPLESHSISPPPSRAPPLS